MKLYFSTYLYVLPRSMNYTHLTKHDYPPLFQTYPKPWTTYRPHYFLEYLHCTNPCIIPIGIRYIYIYISCILNASTSRICKNT